jgi:hypothetical protein
MSRDDIKDKSGLVPPFKVGDKIRRVGLDAVSIKIGDIITVDSIRHRKCDNV